MQIQPINYKSHNINPTFGYWKRETIVKGRGIVRNDTVFFREQNFFPMLTKFFSEKFKDVSKVNVYSYGCSDGSEPFTFAMRMLTMQGEKNPKKFFPIIARDIDPVAIQKAINNDYKMIKNEKDYIDHFTFGQFERFFYQPYGEPQNNVDGTQVFVRNELYDSVNFAIGDIFKDYKKIKPKNTILMAMNFWPYTDFPTRKWFFRKLYQHLDSGSYLVTGEFDHRGIGWNLGDFHQEIKNAGFKLTSLSHVYVKE